MNIASMVKLYLRRLPEPLLTYELYTDWLRLDQQQQQNLIRARLLIEAERTRSVGLVVINGNNVQFAIGTIVVATLSLVLAVLVVPFLFLKIQSLNSQAQVLTASFWLSLLYNENPL